MFGDLNGNGTVGVVDLMILNECLGSDDPDCCIADLNLDGNVGMIDLMLMGGAMVEFVPVTAYGSKTQLNEESHRLLGLTSQFEYRIVAGVVDPKM